MGGAALKLSAWLRRAAPLGWLWLAAVGPLLVYVLVVQRSVGTIFGTALQLALACALALPLRLPRHPRAFRWLLLGVLGLSLVGGTAEREFSRNDWQVSDKAGLWSSLRGQNTVQKVGFRSWNAAGAEQANLTMDVRLRSGNPGWDWFRSNSRFALEQRREADVSFTRVTFPEKQAAEGQPYLMRTFDTRESLQTRIFKVIFEIRRAPPPGSARVTAGVAGAEVTGTEPPPLERGEPIGGRDCSGVSLQAWNERGGGRCLPLTLTGSWQRYSLSWRVPDEIDPAAHVVRFLVQGFGGETLDLRRVLLFRGLASLGPLQPQGGAVQIAWGGAPEAHSGFSFVPTSEWRTLSLDAVKGDQPSDTLSVQLSGGDGLVLETRNVLVTTPDGAPLPAAVSSARQTIVFGDPNLAGHTLGTLGLAFVSLASPLWAVLGAALTLFGMTLTGSRAALVGVVAGLLWLGWLALPKHRRLKRTYLGLVLLVAVGGAGLLLLAQFWPRLAALRLLSLSEVTSRSDIWQAALSAFAAHPWSGLGAGGFARYWAAEHSGEAVQHAHNFWLEAAVSYGVLGLVSALALTLGLLLLAQRWGGIRALALVGGVLVMNLFDTTLFYSGVLFPLMLTLAAFRPSSPGLQTVVSLNAHNNGVAASHLPQAAIPQTSLPKAPIPQTPSE